MPSWRDSFPGSPVVNFDLDDGSSIPVLRENARRMGFVDQLQEMAAGAPPPPPAPEQPAMPTLPGVGAVPVAPGVLPQPPAPAPAPAQAPVTVPAAAAAAKQPSPSAAVNVERELRDSDVTAPDFAPDAVSGGSLPVEPPQAPQVAGDTTGGGVDLDARNRAAADPSQVTRPSVSVTGGVSGAGERAGGPMSQEEVDQRAAEERMRVVESSNYRLAQIESERAAAMEKLDRDYAALQKDLGDSIKKAADHKIKNPIDQWGTGRKIGAVLMAVISGIGSALKRQGDKNPALDLIMAHVDQSIALQMADRDKLGQDVTRKRQQIADFDGLLTNRNAKFHAERAALLEAEARKIMAVGAKAANESVRFEYEAMANSLLAKAQEDARAAAQVEFDNGLKVAEFQIKAAKAEEEIKKIQAETRKLQGGGGGGGGGGGAKAAREKRVGLSDDEMNLLGREDRERAVRLWDGSWALTNSKENAGEVNKKMAKSRTLIQGIDRVFDVTASHPGTVDKIISRVGVEDKDIAVAKQAIEQLKLNAVQYYELGVISETDKVLLENLGADDASITAFFENIWPKLGEWRKGIEADARTYAQQYGVDIDSESTYGRTPEKPKTPPKDSYVTKYESAPTFDDKTKLVYAPGATDTQTAVDGILESTRDDYPERIAQFARAQVGAKQQMATVRGRLAETQAEIEKLKAKGKKLDQRGKSRLEELRAREIELSNQVVNSDRAAKAFEDEKDKAIRERNRAQQNAAKADERKQAERKRREEQGDVKGRMQ